jgi:hypothetical protein
LLKYFYAMRSIQRVVQTPAYNEATVNINYLGNMLTYGQRGLQFSYNFINLPMAVTGPNGTTVYSFSADGTKVGVEDNGGNGYRYKVL